MSSFNGSKYCQGSSRSRHSKLCQDVKRSIRRQQVSPRTSFTFLSPRDTFFSSGPPLQLFMCVSKLSKVVWLLSVGGCLLVVVVGSSIVEHATVSAEVSYFEFVTNFEHNVIALRGIWRCHADRKSPMFL